jgi:hypothetical protein
MYTQNKVAVFAENYSAAQNMLWAQYGIANVGTINEVSSGGGIGIITTGSSEPLDRTSFLSMVALALGIGAYIIFASMPETKPWAVWAGVIAFVASVSPSMMITLSLCEVGTFVIWRLIH